MEIDIKRAILYGSGLLGFFQEEKNFTGMNVVVERKKLLHALMVFGGKIGLNVKEKEMDKLVKDIETGKINVEIVENFEKIQNKKRMSKYRVKVNFGMLETIAEEAMASCENCERNMKKCLLRRALLDCNIENKICQYKQI